MRIMASADICLDTAVGNPFNHRSTMVKVIEYLALARPTVAFALRESVNTAGDAACFAPCGDWDAFAALVTELARSEPLRREMSRRAAARRETLVWERSEAELLGAYGRMLAR
jgi:glycosyltransferase involved in cell wall biosynthesis